MQGYEDSRKRLIFGKYRVIYNYINETLYIMGIDSRGDIYK